LDVLFYETRLATDEASIQQVLTGSAMIDIATDGSHDISRGIITYGWVVAINEQVIAKGRGPGEGHPQLVESFRAEAYGLASSTAFLKLMIRHFQIKSKDKKWFFHIDNKSLIRRMESYREENVTARWEHKPDIDITDEAHDNINNIDAQFLFIRSHQDRAQNQKISFPAQMNILADSLAAQQMELMKKPRKRITIRHHHLIIRDMVVTKDLQRIILEAASKIPMQQYYHDKFGWAAQTFKEVHWELQHRALKGYDINDQQRILKYVHKWLPTNKRMHREQQSKTQRRPMCHFLVEDELHLFQCRHPIQTR
jgi:hypothetical protein